MIFLSWNVDKIQAVEKVSSTLIRLWSMSIKLFLSIDLNILAKLLAGFKW